MATDNDDPKDDPVKVKQLLEWAARKAVGAPTTEEAPPIDAETRAQLEQWFGVPSYASLEEKGKAAASIAPVEDPDVVRVRERRETAIANVSPEMLAAVHRRLERCDSLLVFEAEIDLDRGLAIKPDMPLLDLAMIDRVGSIAEPREVEIPEELQDDLRDCTPQALLRDLHRAEIDFDKTFEVNDVMLESRIDIGSMVTEAMKTSWALPPLGPRPFVEGSELLREAAALRRVASTDIPRPNARVKE